MRRPGSENLEIHFRSFRLPIPFRFRTTDPGLRQRSAHRSRLESPDHGLTTRGLATRTGIRNSGRALAGGARVSPNGGGRGARCRCPQPRSTLADAWRCCVCRISHPPSVGQHGSFADVRSWRAAVGRSKGCTLRRGLTASASGVGADRTVAQHNRRSARAPSRSAGGISLRVPDGRPRGAPNHDHRPPVPRRRTFAAACGPGCDDGEDRAQDVVRIQNSEFRSEESGRFLLPHQRRFRSAQLSSVR